MNFRRARRIVPAVCVGLILIGKPASAEEGPVIPGVVSAGGSAHDQPRATSPKPALRELCPRCATRCARLGRDGRRTDHGHWGKAAPGCARLVGQSRWRGRCAIRARQHELQGVPQSLRCAKFRRQGAGRPGKRCARQPVRSANAERCCPSRGARERDRECRIGSRSKWLGFQQDATDAEDADAVGASSTGQRTAATVEFHETAALFAGIERSLACCGNASESIHHVGRSTSLQVLQVVIQDAAAGRF